MSITRSRWGLSLRRAGLCLTVLGLFAGAGLLAVQTPAVQRWLVRSPVMDRLYRRFSPDPQPYDTFREALLQHFPGFAYASITQRVVGSEHDPEAIIHKLTAFVHENVFAHRAYAPIDEVPVDVLRRGIGWCDQMSYLLVELLDGRDIPALVLLLRNEQGVSPHTVVNVHLKGAWRMVDPLYMYIPTNRSQEIATRDEVCRGEAEFAYLPPQKIGLPVYLGLFCNEPTQRMRNVAAQALEVDAKAAQRTKARSGSWQRLFALPAWVGSDLYIDLYVQAMREQYESEDEYAYAAARTYHVLGRFPEARRWYRRVLAAVPPSPHRDESHFFLGLVAYHAGDYEGARKIFDEILEDPHSSRWANYARLFAGKALLARGATAEARRYLQQVDVGDGEAPRDSMRLLQAIADNQPAVL